MEENRPRRVDLKSGAAGLGLGLALFALAPLDAYLDRRLMPVENKIVALKEVSDVKLDNIQKTVNDIRFLIENQGREYNALNARVMNVEFVTGINKPNGGK